MRMVSLQCVSSYAASGPSLSWRRPNSFWTSRYMDSRRYECVGEWWAEKSPWRGRGTLGIWKEMVSLEPAPHSKRRKGKKSGLTWRAAHQCASSCASSAIPSQPWRSRILRIWKVCLRCEVSRVGGLYPRGQMVWRIFGICRAFHLKEGKKNAIELRKNTWSALNNPADC